MREETKTTTVIRFLDTDNEYVYVSGTNEVAYDRLHCYDAYSLEDAEDYSDQSKERIAEILEAFQDQNVDHECEVVRITMKTTIEDIMENDDVFKELRQRGALAKLSEKEIKALNLTSIAVYIKTKYHNA